MLDFDEFISEPLNEQTLLKSCTQPAIKTSLNLDDFAYLGEMKAMMLGLSSVLICYFIEKA